MKLPRISSLWVGVGLLFGLMLAAWAVLLHLAAKNPVEQVPLEATATRSPEAR